MGGSANDPASSRRNPRYSRVLFRAPSDASSLALIALVAIVSALLLWLPPYSVTDLLLRILLPFFLPALVAGFATPGLAAVLGGRLSLRRSLLLALTASAVAVPLLVLWRVLGLVLPVVLDVPVAGVFLFLQGPSLWFREMSLFGLSRPSHARSLVPALLQPLLAAAGIFALVAPTPTLLLAAGLFLAIAVGSCALLLRSADRPIRREFGMSGVSLIRPLLDHINLRDPAATEALEAFFRRFAKPATLGVSVLALRSSGRTRATVVLPTVHPGPFAALGSSDLPRKLAERLGPEAGVVFVPHTPCNHDLDLPGGTEVERVAEAARGLAQRLEGPQAPVLSRLMGATPESLARAQRVGDSVLVVVSQAPAPTDDIDFAVADRIRAAAHDASALRVMLVDGHNSYVEDEGDITYGTPGAERLARDALAAVAAVRNTPRAPGFEVGVALRTGYSTRADGIGPAGIRCLVLRGGGATTAYVLIDGNNLLLGHRATILAALVGLVDTAEVLTTDNHVVHEVDGSINPVGERFPADRLAQEIRGIVTEAVADLGPAEVFSGDTTIEEVPVLGPDWTARLLTSLGDTVSMFGHAFVMTFLLLLAASIIVLAALY